MTVALTARAESVKTRAALQKLQRVPASSSAPDWHESCPSPFAVENRLATTLWWRRAVVAIEERVAMIEGRLLEQTQTFAAIRQDIADLGRRMEQRFAANDQRFAAIDQHFASIDQRFASLEQKMSTQFFWLLGAQMTTTLAIIAALLNR
jgi:uncharacterized coiled-coil protein SlyX